MVDLVVLVDYREKVKENEEKDKYMDLARNLLKLRNKDETNCN